jgi:hypothetical protein
MTAGQVPETLITGETADISRICQFGWYDWVMYHDPAKFPDNKLTLDQKRDFDTTPLIPRGGVLARGRVTRRKRDANGNPTERSHDSPALDTRSYIVEFMILPDGTKAPIGYQRMNCHMVFDVKMKDFRRKANLSPGDI